MTTAWVPLVERRVTKAHGTQIRVVTNETEDGIEREVLPMEPGQEFEYRYGAPS